MTWAEWKRYVLNILVALDQLVNALMGGDPDETLSSAAGKLATGDRVTDCKSCLWLARAFCSVLDIIDRGHCARAIEMDEGKHAIVMRVGRGDPNL